MKQFSRQFRECEAAGLVLQAPLTNLPEPVTIHSFYTRNPITGMRGDYVVCNHLETQAVVKAATINMCGTFKDSGPCGPCNMHCVKHRRSL
jgi:hypothetical protein